jgi:hypothetical protein
MDISRSMSTECVVVPTVASAIPFFQASIQNVRAAKETMPRFRDLGFTISNISDIMQVSLRVAGGMG